jgi:hypothetical protein
MSADGAVFTAGMVTLGSTVSAGVLPKSMGGKGQLPDAKLFIGTGLTFTGLSILGDFAPQVAKPLAASVALTAFLFYGLPVLDAVFTQQHAAKTSANHAQQPTKSTSLASQAGTLVTSGGWQKYVITPGG